jgi:phosphate starvation-inducible protein PhoH and related proteins
MAKKPSRRAKEILSTDFFTDFKIDQKFHFNENHKKFVEKAFDEGTNILFADGPAGTAKTYCATYVALSMLKSRKVEEIWYIRSIVESATRKLGSLPGEVDDKFKPWSIPLLEKCDELIGTHMSNLLMEQNYIKCVPVNFLRGSTFANSVVIVDEAQNLELGELITVLTRFGRNCKLFIIGDSRQADIPKSGFEKILKAFDDDDGHEHGVHMFKFTEEDITRSKLLKFLVKKISTIK